MSSRDGADLERFPAMATPFIEAESSFTPDDETFLATLPLPSGSATSVGFPQMMFLDVCVILTCFTLLVAWYVPDELFKVD